MRVKYLLGYPGAGKTTALVSALEKLDVDPMDVDLPVPHVRYGNVIHLGRHRHPFGGTDTLSMSIQPKVVDWLVNNKGDELVVGEGDRLANMKFFDALRGAGVPLELILLDLQPQVAVERSRQRAKEIGSKEQSITWFKGRITKVDTLVGRYRVTEIDATAPPSEVAAALWAAAVAHAPA